jgi:glutathione S-transferase
MREKEHKSPAYLKLNPNGKVPTLTDGDFTIWESIAINLYLAESYKPELLGKNTKERGLVYQWSTWAIAELQAPVIEAFIQLVFVPEDKRDLAAIEKATARIPTLLAALDSSLENRKYLAGAEFTLADLNVASVVTICSQIKFDTSGFKNIQKWLANISEREAYQKYMGLCR